MDFYLLCCQVQEDSTNVKPDNDIPICSVWSICVYAGRCLTMKSVKCCWWTSVMAFLFYCTIVLSKCTITKDSETSLLKPMSLKKLGETLSWHFFSMAQFISKVVLKFAMCIAWLPYHLNLKVSTKKLIKILSFQSVCVSLCHWVSQSTSKFLCP